MVVPRASAPFTRSLSATNIRNTPTARNAASASASSPPWDTLAHRRDPPRPPGHQLGAAQRRPLPPRSFPHRHQPARPPLHRSMARCRAADRSAPLRRKHPAPHLRIMDWRRPRRPPARHPAGHGIQPRRGPARPPSSFWKGNSATLPRSSPFPVRSPRSRRNSRSASTS